MAADDGADVVDIHRLGAEALLDLLRHGAGVQLAVGVADEHGLIFRVDAQRFDLVQQRLDGGLAAPRLAHRHQLALVGGVHDGLDGEHGAQQSGGGADTAAHFQIVQVVHGEPVADAEAVVLHPFGQLRRRETRLLLLRRQIQEQTLPQGGAEGVHHVDLRLRKLRTQVVRGDDGGLIRRGQRRGEAHAHDVAAALQNFAHGVLELTHVHRRGGGQLAGADALIKLLVGNGAARQIVGVVLPVHVHGQRQNLQLQLPRHVVRQVAAAIGHQNIVTHNIPSLVVDLLVCKPFYI